MLIPLRGGAHILNEMTRQEIDRIYDNRTTSVHGDGQNEYRGDIFAQQSPIPTDLNSFYGVGPNVLTRDELQDVVNRMSNDATRLREGYNTAFPDDPYYSPNQGTPLPDEFRLNKYFSDYERHDSGDDDDYDVLNYLNENPQEKGLADYFAEAGAVGWLYDRSFTTPEKAALMKGLEVARGLNDYRRQQNLEQMRKDMTYSDFLGELMQEREANPDLYDFSISAHPQEKESVKPRARQRYIK